MNTDQALELRDTLSRKPAKENQRLRSYKKLSLASGLSISISPRLQSDLRRRHMIVALNGNLFPAYGKTEALAEEAKARWTRIATRDPHALLRFDMEV